MNLINTNDLTIYKKNGNIQSGGMKLNNIFKYNDLPAMVALSSNKKKIGGSIDSLLNMEKISVPIGLLLLNTVTNNKNMDLILKKHKNKDSSVDTIENLNKKTNIIPDELYDSLINQYTNLNTINNKNQNNKKMTKRKKDKKRIKKRKNKKTRKLY